MGATRLALLAALVIFLPGFSFVRAADFDLDSLPPYMPPAGEKISGTIRVWGHGSFKRDFMGVLLRRWTAEFTRFHPDAKIENRMFGTASAIGALATGAGNLALLGEEISPAAAKLFQRVKGYAPTEIDVATGSLDVNFFDYAHMIFVHRDNPLAGLTLAQLDAIFGDEHRRGSKNIRTWGELGLTGEWADKPIQPHAWRIEEDFALFFRERVLAGSHRWNPATKEYEHVLGPDGVQYDHGRQILDALARDRFGIAISNVRYAVPQVKALPLAWRDGAPFYPPTRENLIAQNYPLTRIIPAFVDCPPGGTVEPVVREFLRYLLSRDGQRALVEAGGYLPLGTEAIRAQRTKLNAIAGVGRTVLGEPRLGGDASPHHPVIRIWGSSSLAPLAREWTQAFEKTHPDTRVETRMMIGSDAAMAGLYTSQADIALIGRDAAANEVKAFEWIFRRKPARIEVATGSVGAAGHSPALAVLVSRDNPLAQLTLAQLDAMFGVECRRGAPAPLRTWGELGLKGEWAGQPIHLYAPDADTGTGHFFREIVLDDSRRENWSRVREFDGDDAGGKTAAALAGDRFGLGVANLDAAGATLKALAIAAEPGGPFVAVTRESVAERSYPLARAVVAYVNRKPDAPLEANVRELLNYILSREGQEIVAQTRTYLPLTDSRAAQQRASLN